MYMHILVKKVFLVFVMAFLSIPASWAGDEEEMKKKIEKKLGTSIKSVVKTPYLGLYEVFTGRGIVYIDQKLEVIFDGKIIDGKKMTNITSERLRRLLRIDFSELPLERAIQYKVGKGERRIATFEDPNCGYCKRLAKDLQKMKNVTVYTFLFPILSGDSLSKSKQIWCAKDRSKMWVDWMVEGKSPTGDSDCTAAKEIDQNVELGRELSIRGTPAIFFEDGERFPGAMSPESIERKLEKLALKKKP